MPYIALIIPLLFAALFVFALFRKVRLYDCFTEGVKDAIPLAVSLFPYLAAVLILSELFEQSGLSQALTTLIAPALNALGIPPEIAGLVLIKPFSGSGALSVVSDLFAQYGADSYIGRCASVVYAAGETVFYLSAVYFAGRKNKKPVLPVAVAFFANLCAVALGCLFCRIL